MSTQDEQYRARVRSAITLVPTGSRADIEESFGLFCYDRLPVSVWPVCMVVTTRHYGWRAYVLRFALWAMARAGHVVITPERYGT